MAHRRLFSNGISKESPLGSPATGTNFSSCTLTNVGTNQAGNYSVEVINGHGSVMSSNATLTVVVPPIITTQPMNRTNNVATTATFSVIASSPSLLSYQWQKNGTNLTNGGKDFRRDQQHVDHRQCFG